MEDEEEGAEKETSPDYIIQINSKKKHVDDTLNAQVCKRGKMAHLISILSLIFVQFLWFYCLFMEVFAVLEVFLNGSYIG